MKLIKYQQFMPQVDETAFIADHVVICGNTKVGRNSSIWYNAVLRADVAPITIGENTNIQDGSVIHTSRFNGPVIIGDNVTAGHMALIHACEVQSNSFIGMRAIVMDHAVIEECGFVAAGALIPPNKVVRKKELWAGSPAKFVRYLTDEEIAKMQDTVETYVRLAREHKQATAT
jgi:carbonic anhydrase/acetyltransferase-like protein (isoleucine patch superfamily)